MANEKRLIDANALKNLVCHKCNEDYSDEPCEPCDCSFIYAVDKAPAVDAVEVVHGEWEITENDYLDLVELKCSVCGVSYGFEGYEYCTSQNYHYCPNCGAKMDGEGREGE